MEEVHLWRDRYRVLFERNVAGIILTNAEGRIIDCNEPCARIFGFDSRKQMLAHSAWDFYFDRADREAMIERLRGRRNWPAEEFCLRGRNGVPVWVLATRTVVSFAEGRPELFQGTLIDITAREKAQASLRQNETAEPSVRMPTGQGARMAELSERIGNILRRVSKSLQPENLSQIDRAEMKECLLALEQIKMLMSELELLHLFPE
jgi:PAS domain S-box-containing protein